MLIVFHTQHLSAPMPKKEQKLFARREAKTLASPPAMEQVIKLVKTYRLASGLAERLRLAEAIFRLIASDLRAFVFSAIKPHAADDVSQEVLISITGSLKKFEGSSNEEFWAWCYKIARRRIYDHIRKKTSDRLQPLPHEELLDLVDASAQAAPLTAGVKDDLEYALKLLDKSKPECRDYLWNHYVTGFDYGEIAEERDMSYANVRMKIVRCLDEAKSLVS
jgi:RNA polymerase sigma factor (sigma-70 family)